MHNHTLKSAKAVHTMIHNFPLLFHAVAQSQETNVFVNMCQVSLFPVLPHSLIQASQQPVARVTYLLIL